MKKPPRIRAYCRQCKHEQSFEQIQVHHGLHLFLSLATCGLWLVSWASIVLGARFRPWRCLHCGWHDPGPKGANEGTPGESHWTRRHQRQGPRRRSGSEAEARRSKEGGGA